MPEPHHRIIETERKKGAAYISRVKSHTARRDALFERFSEKIAHNPDLDRTLVSFQANKQLPFYSWFKYKEGFSRQLVQYLLQTLMPQPGVLLDPFAGSGSALFASAELGWEARGIELLPVGIYAIQAQLAAERVNAAAFEQAVTEVLAADFSRHYDEKYAFDHIAITNGAYPDNEEGEMIGYIALCYQRVADQDTQTLLLYAAFCVLEDISYTRKDGQYLRWDTRSGRSLGKKPFDKGIIRGFREAVESKLRQIADDLRGQPQQLALFEETPQKKQELKEHIHIQPGSCLDLLPTMPANSVDFVLTSPPYANRYDYTRTYALELVYLGCSDAEIKNLRQTMLSCTVENKDKRDRLGQYYRELDRNEDFITIDETFNRQAALQEVLSILNTYRDEKKLNNPHIARLIRNYFYEMCFVVFELARLLRPGGMVAMVNDNVRYAGEEVPVDLILSDMAETFGLTTRSIWTLGRGKGNSSQQMGHHGRSELRKCVYVWQKKQKA
jgi:DNA modification methylase